LAEAVEQIGRESATDLVLGSVVGEWLTASGASFLAIESDGTFFGDDYDAGRWDATADSITFDYDGTVSAGDPHAYTVVRDRLSILYEGSSINYTRLSGVRDTLVVGIWSLVTDGDPATLVLSPAGRFRESTSSRDRKGYWFSDDNRLILVDGFTRVFDYSVNATRLTLVRDGDLGQYDRQ
jgi:hypothetical protein